LLLVYVSALAGCKAKPSGRTDPPPGIAYTYQPLNPTTVWIRDPTEDEQTQQKWEDGDETSAEFYQALLRDLDTETVRIAVDRLDSSAEGSGGVVSTSVKGQNYVLIVDYIKYFSHSQPIDTDYPCKNLQGQYEPKPFKRSVPIYIGVGLRIRAEFKALQSGLNISGLPALAIAASFNGISGRLTVQTLGITGQEVTGLLPLLSDISVASIQNAVQAVAAIKSKIYETSTTVYPKIVGFESPGTDPALVGAITEKLYATEIWMCPVMIKCPQNQTKKMLWLQWFADWPQEDGSAEQGTGTKASEPAVGRRDV